MKVVTGAAVTRKADDWMRTLLTFFLGVVIGFMASVSAFSSRISAIEVTTEAHTKQLDAIGPKMDRISDDISEIKQRLPR